MILGQKLGRDQGCYNFHPHHSKPLLLEISSRSHQQSHSPPFPQIRPPFSFFFLAYKSTSSLSTDLPQPHHTRHRLFLSTAPRSGGPPLVPSLSGARLHSSSSPPPSPPVDLLPSSTAAIFSGSARRRRPLSSSWQISAFFLSSPTAAGAVLLLCRRSSRLPAFLGFTSFSGLKHSRHRPRLSLSRCATDADPVSSSPPAAGIAFFLLSSRRARRCSSSAAGLGSVLLFSHRLHFSFRSGCGSTLPQPRCRFFSGSTQQAADVPLPRLRPSSAAGVAASSPPLSSARSGYMVFCSSLALPTLANRRPLPLRRPDDHLLHRSSHWCSSDSIFIDIWATNSTTFSSILYLHPQLVFM